MKKPLLIGAVLLTVPALAAVRPAAVFTDGAVLQANRPVPVWGMADPGEKVTVSFAGQTKKTKAGADGKWLVKLDPMKYSSVGRELVIGSTKLSDILVGEVWLGIGQSNMEFPLEHCEEGKVISKGGVLPETVRYFHMPKDGDEKPRDMFAIPEGVKWRAYTKDNERQNKRSSMLLALFAQRLAPALDVPVGVIGAAVGGANLETWMSAEAIRDAGMEEEAARLLKTCEGWYANDIKKWENRPESEKNKPYPKVNFESRPTQSWNAMVPPLAPYALAGIVWYQGEMNSGWQKYDKQFPFFAKHFRSAFDAQDIPFYIIQLPVSKSDHWVRIRDIHRKMSETIGRSGLVVQIDGTDTDLHPRDKSTLATRLANLALSDCYGRRIVARSPAPVKAAAKDGKVRVAFKDVGEGLRLSAGDAPRTFELVESGDKGVPCEARIVGKNTVELTVPDGMTAPTRVRYAWSAKPDVNLVNSAGLPATPFEIELK